MARVGTAVEDCRNWRGARLQTHERPLKIAAYIKPARIEINAKRLKP
jgi:hypothetical protein